MSDAANRPAPPRAAVRDALLAGVFTRLERVLAAETAALRALKPVDTTPYAVQKSQALLELARLMRTGDLDAASPAIRDRMAALRLRLDENRAALELHLDAARQVFDTVSKAMSDAESDRTYSASPVRQKAKRT
jgi:hypothetical protein